MQGTLLGSMEDTETCVTQPLMEEVKHVLILCTRHNMIWYKALWQMHLKCMETALVPSCSLTLMLPILSLNSGNLMLGMSLKATPSRVPCVIAHFRPFPPTQTSPIVSCLCLSVSPSRACSLSHSVPSFELALL